MYLYVMLALRIYLIDSQLIKSIANWSFQRIWTFIQMQSDCIPRKRAINLLHIYLLLCSDVYSVHTLCASSIWIPPKKLSIDPIVNFLLQIKIADVLIHKYYIYFLRSHWTVLLAFDSSVVPRWIRFGSVQLSPWKHLQLRSFIGRWPQLRDFPIP